MTEALETLAPGKTAKDRLMQLVGFTIGAEQFGVNILMVQEIIRSTPITSVPNAPAFVEGVINLRGNIIPVIDLRKRLDLEAGEMDPAETWIIILDIEGKITGFIVDSVTEVLKIQESGIEPPPDIIPERVFGIVFQIILCILGGMQDIRTNLHKGMEFAAFYTVR